jgi:hypothetical protein
VNSFEMEEQKTEFCQVDLSNCEDLYDKFYKITKSDAKSQCIPLALIPSHLLEKCKNEAPSSSLFLYNLPKKVNKDEILQLLHEVFPEEISDNTRVKVEILKGRLKGQGFLHLSSVEAATEIRDTLFGFPFQGKPMILQFSRAPS